jgi:hypothetical protein
MVVANVMLLPFWLKGTEERLNSVGEGGTVIIDVPSSVVVKVGELGMSRGPRGPAAELWGDRRPPAFVRLWSEDVVSGGEVLSSSAARSVVTMARMVWSSEGMAERKGG